MQPVQEMEENSVFAFIRRGGGRICDRNDTPNPEEHNCWKMFSDSNDIIAINPTLE